MVSEKLVVLYTACLSLFQDDRCCYDTALVWAGLGLNHDSYMLYLPKSVLLSFFFSSDE